MHVGVDDVGPAKGEQGVSGVITLQGFPRQVHEALREKVELGRLVRDVMACRQVGYKPLDGKSE